MRRVALSVMAAAMLHLAPAWAGPGSHYEEGPITIQKTEGFSDEGAAVIRVAGDVTFKIKVYEDTFFDKTIINANAHMDNTTGRKLHAVYAISFHDAQRRTIGAHQGSWELDPNEDINYGSALIYVPNMLIRSVTSYKHRTTVTPIP